MRILVTFTLLSLLSNPALSLDGQRSGFWGELGIGLGSVRWEQSTDGFGSFSDSDTGLATSIKLGYGFSESFQLYYLRNATWTDADELDGIFAEGISGIGATFWVSPSVYLLTGIGVGDLTYISFDEDEEESDSESGSAYSLGVGYEFAKHQNVQLSLTRTDIDTDSSTNYEADMFQLIYSHSFY